LGISGRKPVPGDREIMANIVAERLVKHLEESNFVIDHHNWIKSAATKLVLPGEILWQAMRQNGRYFAWIRWRSRAVALARATFHSA
jgi:hypothetical protein